MKVLLFLIFSALLILVFLSYFLFKKYKNIKDDENKIFLAVKRARYGDIYAKLGKLNNNELESAINRLLETIYDRELMIREYQAALSKKNLSLEEILKQEKQLQSFKEEFAATLTHDMKVPVIAELNSINYLLDGRFGLLNEKQKEILNLMKSSNTELKELIENMLETYKLEKSSIVLNITKNDLNDFLFRIVSEMEPIAIERKNKIIMNFSKTVSLLINFDEFQIKRIIKNLIQNAITYSPDNTDIKIYSELEEDKVKIYVTNEGQNISEKDLNLIFNKYYTGYSKYKKVGTGLGLYLSQQIALAHKGCIEVDSSKNNYTTFILTIPYGFD